MACRYCRIVTFITFIICFLFVVVDRDVADRDHASASTAVHARRRPASRESGRLGRHLSRVVGLDRVARAAVSASSPDRSLPHEHRDVERQLSMEHHIHRPPSIVFVFLFFLISAVVIIGRVVDLLPVGGVSKAARVDVEALVRQAS